VGTGPKAGGRTTAAAPAPQIIPRRWPPVIPRRWPATVARQFGLPRHQGRGDLGVATAHATSLLADNPLDADAYFLDGMVALNAGEPARAVSSPRRALYADATFALAPFTLGRAYDAAGDGAAACRVRLGRP
jgi:hypothetical protein